MAILDGTTYQVGRDGVSVVPDDAQIPFAVVTHFLPESTVNLEKVTSFDDLIEQLDALRNTGNEFFAVRISGAFDYIKTRTVCKSGICRRAKVPDWMCRLSTFSIFAWLSR